MHRLQQHILHQLIHHHDRRYADLKPADIEGNLFMYHLRQLTRAGHVAKRSDGRYELTPDGKRYADGLSLKTFTPRAQPRIVTLIVCQNAAGQYLFMRRKRQPLLGMVGFPYGKVHLGENIHTSAIRELVEKTGLTAEVIHRGDGYVTICQGGQPVSQIMFHLFWATNPTGSLLADSSAGEVFWGDAADIDNSYMPSVPDLIKLLRERHDHFFVELTYS